MSQLTVLTIDDNDSIRLSIASYLEDVGFDVLDADCGENGIKIIDEEEIDVILTDTHMPGLSGIDVLKYVKDNKPDIPIIIISGAGEIQFAVEALRAGAWDYITKPIEDLSFLLYSIEKVLKRVNLIKENREKSAEIEQKNITLNETVKMLKSTQFQLVESKKMASLGYMVKGVAHEINTPLGVCMTSTSYINEQAQEIEILNSEKRMKLSDFESFTKDTKNLTGIIFNSLQSINNLITNFKQLSVDPDILQKKKFSLNDSISSVIMLVSSSYPNKTINFELTGDETIVRSYPEIMNRIFIKLTENSIIHGFQNTSQGNISVDISSNDVSLNILFKNNGELISDDVINHIFDPFFTVNKKMGSGLGLCIVFNLISFTLHGTISCINQSDGVVFKISIPNQQIKV